jgi:LDH2 family malate/lactate/ureidoglycolate dehydrogenase
LHAWSTKLALLHTHSVVLYIFEYQSRSLLHRCRSHKGSNLALMVELLAGPLVGAAVADKLEERNWGNLLLAVDPGLLGDAELIRARTQVR